MRSGQLGRSCPQMSQKTNMMPCDMQYRLHLFASCRFCFCIGFLSKPYSVSLPLNRAIRGTWIWHWQVLFPACVTWQYAQKAFLWALCGPIVQVCLVFAPSNLWHFLYFSNLLSFPWFVNLGWQRTVMGGHFSPALEPARQWRWFLNFVHWTSWLDSRNKFILGYSRWRTCTGNGSSWHYPLHALHWTLVCGLGWRVSCDCNLPCGSCTHPSLQENDNGQGQTLAVKGSF